MKIWNNLKYNNNKYYILNKEIQKINDYVK